MHPLFPVHIKCKFIALLYFWAIPSISENSLFDFHLFYLAFRSNYPNGSCRKNPGGAWNDVPRSWQVCYKLHRQKQWDDPIQQRLHPSIQPQSMLIFQKLSFHNLRNVQRQWKQMCGVLVVDLQDLNHPNSEKSSCCNCVDCTVFLFLPSSHWWIL